LIFLEITSPKKKAGPRKLLPFEKSDTIQAFLQSMEIILRALSMDNCIMGFQFFSDISWF